MLKVETHLRLDGSIASSPNLTDRFPEEDLRSIGDWVWAGYDQDEASRLGWMRRTQAAMDLALQLQKAKSFPWPNASNIAFPLVTIAALQFHARAYPTLISGTSIVKCRTPALDPTGLATLRAERVGTYMSYQVLEEDQAWEEQHDRLLLQVPIVGCAFIKTQYSPSRGHNISDHVSAVSLSMDYYAKSVESCGRKTQVMSLYRNEVHERCKAGTWKDITDEGWYTSPVAPFVPPGQAESDTRTGQRPGAADEATPLTFLEQHCWADFDKDGYAEPYIITVEATTRTVVRIIARWEASSDVERNGRGEVIRIRATEYYTKYGLIPSADNSIYDMGFGVLLGPLNESTNSLVNMLMDSGTMSVASGGFLARGVAIRGGVYKFNPFEWNRVDATGGDLQKGIVPFPAREPSAVLFSLLTFLVNYTQRISGSTDAVVGENPGQNTPAETQRSMIEQGTKIYNALFKRMWRCMKGEFSKLYVLNARYLPITKPFGLGGTINREDFLGDPSQVVPVADPNVSSDQMRLQLALTVADRAHSVGGYDTEVAERNLLRAMKVEGLEHLYPGLEKKPPGTDPKVVLEQIKIMGKQQLDEAAGKREQEMFLVKMMEESRKNDATILLMEAQAQEAAANADAQPVGNQIAIMDAMIGAAKNRSEVLKSHIDLAIKALELQQAKVEANAPAPTK